MLGCDIGIEVGDIDGVVVGFRYGCPDGDLIGVAVGWFDGRLRTGCSDGVSTGLDVG